MKQADWNSAPAGTTHFNPLGRTVFWFYKAAGGWLMFKGDAWVQCHYAEKVLRALVERPADVAVWSGDGSPPLGAECEVCIGGNWTVCTFEASIRGRSVFYANGVIRAEEYARQFTFRPVRTPEQIANEANRLAAIEEMKQITGDINAYPTWDDALSGLYDAGLRMVVSVQRRL
jgi:hypothetical protein